MVRLGVVIVLVFVVLTASVVTAGDWPEFRGPTGQGISEDADGPVHWNQTENIVWKKAIRGQGWSSPIVFEGCVYLTTAIVNEEGHPTSLRVLGFDAASGKILWDSEVFSRKGPSDKHDKNSHASPTPIIEDGRIYAHFGHMGTGCVDINGKVLWRQSDLTYEPQNGNGGSAVLVDDKLIFSCDGKKGPFVAALNKLSGEVVWKVNRSATIAKQKFSFCTPLVIDDDGRKVIVSPGSGAVFAYNPDDGKELWRVDYGQGYSVVPRPVYGHGMVFISTGFMKANVYAIRLGGEGNVTDTHLAWKITKKAPLTPSMLVVGSELYFVSDSGAVSCVDAVTGRQYWQEKIGGTVSASPVLAGNRIYVITEKGKTVVLKAGTEFEILAENDLQERTLASPAVSGRALFIRTESHLYRIEER
jgi:outer membrane protein assembly factor BamB